MHLQRGAGRIAHTQMEHAVDPAPARIARAAIAARGTESGTASTAPPRRSQRPCPSGRTIAGQGAHIGYTTRRYRPCAGQAPGAATGCAKCDQQRRDRLKGQAPVGPGQGRRGTQDCLYFLCIGALPTSFVINLETGNYLTLNATANAVWDVLKTPQTQDAVEAALLDRFDVVPEDCATAVTSLLTKMRDMKLASPV